MSASFSVAAVLLKLLVTTAGPELHLPDAGQLAAYQPPETTTASPWTSRNSPVDSR